jgi:hypothetical protein
MLNPSLKRCLAACALLFLACFATPFAHSQEKVPAPAKPGTPFGDKTGSLAAADEVLAQVSALTKLSVRSPLKKSLRSREEIRAYVLRRMKEDKSKEERYAAERTAVAFGLVPKDFQMEPFLIDLLTEQIAGLYDPEGHEFYIADWIPLEEQRMVMAHEMTHALQDQHFQIDKWMKAARPNDDAELAREAFLEGSATAAMIDFMLQGMGKSLKDLPDFDPEMLLGELGDTPTLKKAPLFIKDALIFPYFGGLKFSKALLAKSGWDGLAGVFEHPPVSTQQILHPELYPDGRPPEHPVLKVNAKVLRGEWKQLDDNSLGEFGWKEILQQGLGKDRATALASAWSGDRYILLEEKNSRKLVLIYRVTWSDAEHASRFLGQYSEALEKKYAVRSNLFRRSNFFSFEAPDGPVALRCMDRDCVVIEGGNRAFLDDVYEQIGWSPAPELPKDWGRIPAKTAFVPLYLTFGYR